jgi:hypothetical protein
MKLIRAVADVFRAVIWVGRLPGRILAGFFDALEFIGRVIGAVVSTVIGLVVLAFVLIASFSIAYGVSDAVMTWSPVVSFTAGSEFLKDAVRVVAFLLTCGVVVLVLRSLVATRNSPDEMLKSWAEQDYKRAVEEVERRY